MSSVEIQRPEDEQIEFEEAKKHWPAEPYKGLNFYNASDAPLFSERDEEIHLCGRLVTNPATKMLLLHGLSGTGKSSFIRAGLFARVIRENPKFYVPTTNGEPCVIRSTADPISRINEVLAAKLGDVAHFPNLPSELRVQLQNQLSGCSAAGVTERALALRQVLESITTKLFGTLLLIIDQAEEIFTLDPLGNTEVKNAYFSFLEGLCFDRFDIKVIISLRTEYYGQFVDNFRIAPSLTISTVVAGIDQFMLQVVNDVNRLVQAIERPTLQHPVGGVSVRPGLRYWFDYAPGLAGQIGAAVIKHSGEASAWPVMQIVCSDLYESLPEIKDPPEIRRIERQHYDSSGAVDGAIDRFIESAIKNALTKIRITAPGQKLIDGWKHIVSSLVARQQGSTLTSLLLSEKELKEKASDAGIYGPIGRCLDLLAQEKPRLLRSVTSRDLSTNLTVTRYSLGHDALGPSLFQWQETKGREIAERRRVWQRTKLNFLRSAIGAALILLVGLIGAIWIAISSEKLALHATLKTIGAAPRVGDSLLMLAALEKNTPRLWRWFRTQTIEDVDARIGRLLMAAPRVSENSFAAAISEDGGRMVLVDSGGSVVVRSLRPLDAVGHRAYSVPIPNVAFDRFAVGFLRGLDEPVVVSGDYIYFGLGSSKKIADIVAGRISEATSASFAGGVLRFSTYGGAQSSIVVYDSDSAQLKAIEIPSPKGSARAQNFAVYSQFSPIVADTDGDAPNAVQSSKSVELIVKAANGSETYQKVIPENLPTRPEAERLLPWSIGFLPDGNTLAFRNTLEDFTFMEGISDGSLSRLSTLSVSDQERPRVTLQPLRHMAPWGGVLRPPLAAGRTSKGYQIAWLNEHGLSILESDAHGHFRALDGPDERSNPLTSGPLAPNSFSTIQFDSSGNLLILVSTGTDSSTFVNVWDVSEQGFKRIENMEWKALIAEACRVARGYGYFNPGNLVSKGDFEKLHVYSQIQPCS
jgi:hypothetical protein